MSCGQWEVLNSFARNARQRKARRPHVTAMNNRAPNSEEQIKAMRNGRKRRKRLQRAADLKTQRVNQVLAESRALVKTKLEELERSKKKYEYLSRRYYDRWREITQKKARAKDKVCQL